MDDSNISSDWLLYAENDLDAAQYLFDRPFRKQIEIVCYHCQQAAEKALKAFLVFSDIEAPKTHDLAALCRRCALLEESFSEYLVDCGDLSLYVANARYPSKIEITETDAKEALRMAERIVSFCASLITTA